MANLIERLRAAREAWVKVGDAELLVRRPTRLQMGLWQGADPTIPLRESIVGWRGVSEITLGIPGGDGSAVPFDVELCLEWLGDDLELFNAITAQIAKLISGQAERAETVAKN
jgi:hypothetical protein